MGSGVRQGLNYAEVKELRVVLPDQDEAYMENTVAYEQLFLDVDKYQAVMRALADRLYKELHDDK